LLPNCHRKSLPVQQELPQLQLGDWEVLGREVALAQYQRQVHQRIRLRWSVPLIRPELVPCLHHSLFGLWPGIAEALALMAKP